MKNKYVAAAGRWLAAVWLIGAALNAVAQTIQPPVIQWQRVIERTGDEVPMNSRVAKASNGNFGVLSGTQLICLSPAGNLIWRSTITGVYLQSQGRNAQVGNVLNLVPTQDGGFAVLVSDEVSYSLAKFNADGNLAWQKVLANRYSSDTFERNTYVTDITATPDGGYLVVGGVTPGNFHFALATKLDSGGNTVWYNHFLYTDRVYLSANRVINSPDGGYFIVGRASSSLSGGWAAKLDGQGKVIAQNVYNYLSYFDDVIPTPYGPEGFIAVGGSSDEVNTSTLFINPGQTNDNSSGNTISNSLYSRRSIASRGNGSHEILDKISTNNGDFRLTSLTNFNVVRWTKTLGGSGIDAPADVLATDDGGFLIVGTTTSTDGDVQDKTNNNVATWIVKLAANSNPLTLTAPTYNCQTGAITFNTTGGDGSPVEYAAIGITGWTTDPNQFVDRESRTANDVKPFTLMARQSGRVTTYTWDLKAACNRNQEPPTTNFVLTAPTYDCATGAFTFNTTGGDGSAIEYAAIGITGWSTNPNQFVDRESRTANDVKPFTLMARRNGQIVTYTWDLKAACGRARQGVAEPTADLNVTVLGNPAGETATVEITGAAGQPLNLRLMDSRGRLVEQRSVEQTGAVEQQTFDLHRQPSGLLLLHTTTGGQSRTVKVFKQ